MPTTNSNMTPPAIPEIDSVLTSLLAMATEVEHSVCQSLHALRHLQASDASQVFLATRALERMADHVTNIPEDVIFWLRGLEVGIT